MPFKERIKRTIVKSITFRALVILADGLIIYFITKSLVIATSVIIFSNIASTIIYYLHERAWNKVKWGKHKNHK